MKASASADQRAPGRFNQVMKRMMWFPFIGIFLEENNTPSFEDISTSLNLYGLVSALLVTISMAYPMSVSRDELKAIDDLYFNNTGVREFFDGIANGENPPVVTNWFAATAGSPPSYNFAWITSLSTNLLLVSVIAVVINLLYLSFGVNQEDEDLEQLQTEIYWHSGGNILMIAQVTLVVMGICSVTASNVVFHWIKFPDYQVEKVVLPAADYDTSKSTWQVVFQVCHYIPIVTIIVTVVWCQGLQYVLFRNHRTVQELTSAEDRPDWLIMEAEDIYRVLAEYETRVEGFFHMENSKFLLAVSNAAEAKHASKGLLSPMSVKLAETVFEDYTNHKMNAMLRRTSESS